MNVIPKSSYTLFGGIRVYSLPDRLEVALHMPYAPGEPPDQRHIQYHERHNLPKLDDFGQISIFLNDDKTPNRSYPHGDGVESEVIHRQVSDLELLAFYSAEQTKKFLEEERNNSFILWRPITSFFDYFHIRWFKFYSKTLKTDRTQFEKEVIKEVLLPALKQNQENGLAAAIETALPQMKWLPWSANQSHKIALVLKRDGKKEPVKERAPAESPGSVWRPAPQVR
jgi:hypothetical protein